jgi:hypothetical protein
LSKKYGKIVQFLDKKFIYLSTGGAKCRFAGADMTKVCNPCALKLPAW